MLARFIASRPGNAAQRAGLPAVANLGTVLSSDREGMRNLFAPITSSAGFAVNDRTAMQVGTVYACLEKLGGVVLQLPL
ncbi:hypothetical protein ABK046_47670, partial [Streptomyces caeruleatus]